MVIIRYERRQRLKKEANVEMKENFKLSWRELRVYLNLSEYEAKTYLSLVQNGPLKARNLSIIASIPRTKIYHTLRKLVNLGLVVEIPGTPAIFAPSSPIKAFKNYLTENNEKANQLSYVISYLEDAFAKSKDNVNTETGMIWIIQGINQILKKINEMLIKSEESVIIITDENGPFLLYRNFRGLLDKLRKRSVCIQVLTPYRDTNRYVLKQLENLCKIIDSNISLPIIYVNVDDTYCLLAIMVPKIIDLNLEAETAFFAQNQTLAKFFNFLLNIRINS